MEPYHATSSQMPTVTVGKRDLLCCDSLLVLSNTVLLDPVLLDPMLLDHQW